jgi:hypothetical protein
MSPHVTGKVLGPAADMAEVQIEEVISLVQIVGNCV